ncbi:TatD family hydrolase [Lysinibacillus xylanilyticus]|uniref:TatD family hydrolase n=1 Tax=Lysinibacillus xylanilyticus TaxID=582475 RepID=A0ABT4EVQ9_9BACI|nr:TatD family hydrolase [Lysinibacillus xylanilyticus]MCY9549710.1 TatD family hydrolase [Lysinibacillus xylanilyticus]
MLIDAHIHLDQYKEHDIPTLLEEAEHVIAVSMNLPSCEKTLKLSKAYTKVKAAFGFHPEQPLLSDAEEEALFKWIRQHSHEMVAIGEVGLPYYLRQEKAIDVRPYVALLERFIVLAKELNKPIVLHAVYEDAGIVCDLLEKHQVTKAHFHWFKGDEEVIERMISNGYFISVTPDCTYETEIKQLIKKYPIELMMVETDGPWPFECPFDNKRTSPWMMDHSVAVIASIKGLTTQEAARIITRNTTIFYNL